MKRLLVPGFLVLMALSSAVAQAMCVAGRTSNLQREVYQQGVSRVDEKGETYCAVPQMRRFWKVPLKEAPYFEYMTPVLEQDLARKVRVEDTKNLMFLQTDEQEWEWVWDQREDAAVAEEKAGEQADADAQQ